MHQDAAPLTGLIRVIVLGAALSLVPWPGQASFVKLDPVPGDLADPPRQSLQTKRGGLLSRLSGIKQRGKAFNAKCKSVEEGSPQERDCRFQLKELLGLKAPYNRDAGRFNRAVAKASREAERQFVRKEQEELDKSYEAWLERHQRGIRQAAIENKKWAGAVLKAVEADRVPDPAHRPKTAKDLRPGDIILVSPAVGKEGRMGRWISAADEFISGVKSPASHALAFIGRDAGGRMLFLDHQLGEGTRIRGEADFHQYYGTREMHVAAVAKVLTPEQGRRLLRASLEAVERENRHQGPGTGYGVFGKDLVCSQVAAIGVGKATGVDYRREAPQTSLKAIASIDITPAEFFDKQHVGKYFVISPLNLKGPK